jgi:PmbA protein
MSLNIQTVSNSARQIATKLGITKFDLSGSTVDETSVQVDKGEQKQVKASNRAGITVRVWNQENTVGITSTTNIDDIGLELALKTAYEASFFGIKEHAPDFSPEATAPIAEVKVESGESATVPQLVEGLIDAERKLLAAHEAIESVPYNGLAQQYTSQFYINSDGATRSDSHSVVWISLAAKTEQEGKKPRMGGAAELSHSFAKLDIQKCIDEAAEKTISHLNYEKIASGKYTVIFSPDAFLSLLRVFSNLFNAQNILDNQSLSTVESLGTQIASPLLSIADDVLHPSNIGIETFDGEGTPTRRTNLIDKGILSSFIHSAGTAKRMNAQLTGHANMGSKITVSPHFYHVAGGEIVDDKYNFDTAENVILIDDLQALHSGVKSLEGSFSLPFDGWMINKGVKTSIDAAIVAGDFRELLNSIVHIEPKEEFTNGGICPRIWVEGLSVTGE